MDIFYLLKSDKPNKKFKIVYKNEKNEYKSIYFGQAGASDMTKHGDERRKYSYILRHHKKENWLYSGRFTPGFYSRWILWNKKSLQQSIKDTEKRFKIKIINLIV